jgi:hypothetical protein
LAGIVTPVPSAIAFMLGVIIGCIMMNLSRARLIIEMTHQPPNRI